jgi:hypothetical protein
MTTELIRHHKKYLPYYLPLGTLVAYPTIVDGVKAILVGVIYNKKKSQIDDRVVYKIGMPRDTKNLKFINNYERWAYDGVVKLDRKYRGLPKVGDLIALNIGELKLKSNFVVGIVCEVNKVSCLVNWGGNRIKRVRYSSPNWEVVNRF